MKNIQWLAVALVSAASLPLLAQQIDANTHENTSVNAGGAQAQSSSSTNASSNMGGGQANASGAAQSSGSVTGPRGSSASTSGAMNSAAEAKEVHGASTSTGASAYAAGHMRPVSGELQGKLNSKTAKAGDPVIVKTTQKMTTAEGTELPKGSRLIGHVTAAQAHAKGQAESQLGIVFDRAELKGGQSIGIHSIIESVAPPTSAMAAAEADDSADAMMTTAPMSVGDGMDSGARAGSVLGGGRGVVNSAGNAAGHVGSGLNTAAGETMTSAGRISSNAATTAAGTAHTAVGATGSLAAHATAVPGVMLNGDATGSASGMLTATGRNVELQSGTQLVLRVAAQK